MKLEVVRKRSLDRLRHGGIDSPRTCVDWLIEHFVGISPVEILSNPDRRITRKAELAISQAVDRRLAGEPLQYIVGWTEFFGLRLQVSPDVLIPRPETEVVVETALEVVDDRVGCRVLDVGTGSGCIALAIASRRPGALVVACDLSEAALTVACANAENLEMPVVYRAADMEDAESIARCGSDFDLLVSNPPYIPRSEMDSLPKEVVSYEPQSALIAGDDPLRYYRALMARASERLAPRGWLIVEVHADYAQEVASLASTRGFDSVAIRPDLAGLPRVVMARWGGHAGRSAAGVTSIR